MATNYGYDWYISYGINGGSGVLLNGRVTSASSPLHTTTNRVALTAPSGYGTFFVHSRLNNRQCPPSAYTHKQSRAGVYSSSEFSIRGPSFVCRNTTESFISGYIGNEILDYKWSWPSGFTYLGGQGTPNLGLRANNNSNGGAVVLQLKNRCGYTGSPAIQFVGSGSCGFFSSISPNPASSSLQINIPTKNNMTSESATARSSSSPAIKAQLLNSFSVEVWSGSIEKDNYSLDVSRFPNGIYYLKLDYGTEQQTKRVVINH